MVRLKPGLIGSCFSRFFITSSKAREILRDIGLNSIDQVIRPVDSIKGQLVFEHCVELRYRPSDGLRAAASLTNQQWGDAKG